MSDFITEKSEQILRDVQEVRDLLESQKKKHKKECATCSCLRGICPSYLAFADAALSAGRAHDEFQIFYRRYTGVEF